MRDTIEMAREVGFTVGLGSPALEKFERLIAMARADERERMYGKDIDTLLFEEHRLGFEKGSRSEREACAKVCDDLSLSQNSEWEVGTLDCAEAIRARGETK